MASFGKLHFLILPVICVLLIICESDGKRGGGGSRGGSRYRGSSARGSSASSRSSYVTGHISKGSSGYTSSTWKIAAGAGVIYGASRYMQGSYYQKYPDRMPPICTNNYDAAPNGKIYGYFICPLESDPANNTWCCGSSYQEFCCDEFYYQRHPPRQDDQTDTFIISGVLTALVIASIITIYCFRWIRRNAQNGFTFSRKGFMNTSVETKTDLADADHGNQSHPNPATQAAPYLPAEGMYNPPGGPYPPPPGNYYPPSTVPYPTPCGPYPSYPSSTDLPYPPEPISATTSDAVPPPYPPSTDLLYPSEQVPATTSDAAPPPYSPSTDLLYPSEQVPTTISDAAPPPYPGTSTGAAPAQAYGQPITYPVYPQP